MGPCHRLRHIAQTGSLQSWGDNQVSPLESDLSTHFRRGLPGERYGPTSPPSPFQPRCPTDMIRFLIYGRDGRTARTYAIPFVYGSEYSACPIEGPIP